MERNCRYCSKSDVRNFCIYKDNTGATTKIDLCERCVDKIRPYGKFCCICGIKTELKVRILTAKYLSKEEHYYNIYVCCLGECRLQLKKEFIGAKKKAETPSGEKMFKRVCMYCDKPLDDAKVCGRCKFAFYCNVECQRHDWPEHKKFCGYLN